MGAGSAIKHVLYIIKENRTYDQVLGDLGKGNGDPRLTIFGEKVTPNHHAMARQFVLQHGANMSKSVTLSSEALAALERLDYKSNIRDLSHVLALQEEPGRAGVPCLNNPVGPPMYRSLSGTIAYLLGDAFNERLQAYGTVHFPD